MPDWMIFLGLALIVTLQILITAPIILLLAQSMAPQKSDQPLVQSRPRIGVIVPARDEERVLGATLIGILGQLTISDKLVVVADNCRDRTAEIARNLGAAVCERNSQTEIGKGFALAAGRDYLALQGEYDVIIIVDADCEIDNGAIEKLAEVCSAYNTPVQAAYLMRTGGKTVSDRLRAFAWKTKNLVRPLGSFYLGIPAMLTGSGMAFPKSVFDRCSLATSHPVEDLKISLDLALDGIEPLFCAKATVWSEFPQSAAIESIQRRRWEHGYLATMLTYIPQLVYSGFATRRPSLIGLALDLAIPPLALLALLIVFEGALSFMLALLSGSFASLYFSAAHSAAFLMAILTIRFRYCRDLVSVSDLLLVPMYIARKAPIYFWFFIRRQTKWIKTDRD